MKKYKMLIDGKEVVSSTKREFFSINPYTTKPWACLPRAGLNDVSKAVKAAKEAFLGPWSKYTPAQRGKLLRKVGDLIAENVQALAKLEVMDNGKLYSEMLAQVKYIPEQFYYFAGLADKIEGKVIPIDKPNMQNTVHYEPLGVCVGITAWNSPLLLATWKIAPALAAGNTFILKPSEHASVSSLEFIKLFDKAGFPKGVVNILTGFGSEVGKALSEHRDVAKLSFTGSEVGGKAVYQAAARGCKEVTLELGGKSPNIVFPDADFQNAVKGVISGIFAATGQTCIAGSRLLVHKDIHDRFVKALVTFAKKAKMGNPMLSTTNVGPVATKDQYEKILSYIEIAKKEGAKCVLGGKAAKGWFIEPTIFTHVKNSFRIAQEEVFGPVLSVISFRDEKEAIDLANDSKYGLAAGIWTQDCNRILTLPHKIQAGTVWVNTYRAFSYASPTGGYKNSGIGRENGMDTIYSYLQEKSIWISTDSHVANPFMMKV